MERPVQSNLSVTRGIAIIAAGLIAAAGCGDDDDGDAQLIASRTAANMQSTGDLARVTEHFRGAEDLALLPVGTAAPRAIDDVVQRLRTVVTLFDCVVAETDNLTFVELTFDACGLNAPAIPVLDGLVRAELSFETAACGALECPTATVFEVSTSSLTVGPATVSGTWILRDSLAPDTPLEVTGDFVLERDGVAAAISSQGTAVSGGGCVDVELDAVAMLMDDRAALSPVVVAAKGFRRCAQACPSSGEVSVSYGLGDVIAWSYDGSGTTTVVGPRGVEFDIELPCSRAP